MSTPCDRLVRVALAELGIATNTACPGISGATSRFLAAALDGLAEWVFIASAYDNISKCDSEDRK
jgi:hypothetical protein